MRYLVPGPTETAIALHPTMNFVKKILLAHGDEKARRTLTLLLAGAGYDVRPCGCSEMALEAARSEWFDLSLVADPLPEMSSSTSSRP